MDADSYNLPRRLKGAKRRKFNGHKKAQKAQNHAYAGNARDHNCMGMAPGTRMTRMKRIGADYIGIRKMFLISIPPYYLE